MPVATPGVASFRREDGQASVELLAGVPALLLAGGIALQLLVVGYSSSLADGAVEAGALAVAAGRDPVAAVEAALPGWATGRIETEVDGGSLEVRLRPPSLSDGLSRVLEVDASAWVRAPAS